MKGSRMPEKAASTTGSEQFLSIILRTLEFLSEGASTPKRIFSVASSASTWSAYRRIGERGLVERF